jgi:hypothetical protein
VADAAVLLRRRAAEADGGVDPGDCEALAGAVDGFPPAIDILARAVPLYGLTGLLRRLRHDPLAILDAKRELSLALDAACHGLAPRAAQLLRAMAALPEPAGVDDVERLCGGSGEALAALIELVDSSLVDIQRTERGALYRLPAGALVRRRRAAGGGPGGTRPAVPAVAAAVAAVELGANDFGLELLDYWRSISEGPRGG